MTGGAGYIGSHACKALAQAGYLPVTYDNLSRGHKWAVQWGPLEEGDVRDPARLEEVFEEYRPQAVLHFAGLTYVGESVERPELYYDHNVAGTLTLLGAMIRAGVRRFVFSSSAAVYGTPRGERVEEGDPTEPINPYGRCKLFVEQVLADYARARGVRSVSLRYFNAAGADPEGRTGEAHDPETHLIPLVLAAARGDREAVTLFGDDYDTPDGSCIRDYIHVTDLAEAHLMALRALDDETGARAFNLGNGRGFSVKQVIAAASEVTGCVVPVELGPRRPGDPAVLVGSSERAASILGWKPSHAGLHHIIETAWRWMNRSGG